MLSVHGLVKIAKVEGLLQLRPKFWVLNMELLSKELMWDGKERLDSYKASMLFSDESLAKHWAEELSPERIVDVRFASLEGVQVESGKGFIKVKLFPDPSCTVPK